MQLEKGPFVFNTWATTSRSVLHGLVYPRTMRHPYFPWYPCHPGAQAWLRRTWSPGNGLVPQFHGVFWCKMSSMMVAASFWIAATPKLPSAWYFHQNMNACCFFCTRRFSVPHWHFFPIFITIGIPKVFQEEVPRAKARQQLREAQNNDASWGLSAEKWVAMGG